jgi:phosphate transport system protein
MPYHLQRQIDKLKRQLLSLGALVEEGVQSAIAAVLTRNAALAQRVIDGDEKIDRAEIELEEECLHCLALDQPVAQDLRFVVACLKINGELERIGDLAVNLAEQARFLAGQKQVKTIPFDLKGMGERVERMLRKSLDAFVNLDPDEAQAVRDLDDEVDAIHRGMYDKVEEAIRNDTGELEQMIHFLNISRQLERIADHATNVAKDVLYMAKGEIVRHRAARERLAARQGHTRQP